MISIDAKTLWKKENAMNRLIYMAGVGFEEQL